MTIQIELDPATEAQLTAEARHRGLQLEVFAEAILKSAAVSPPERKSPSRPEDVKTVFDAFDAFGPKELPFDDQNWSREMIYGDHP